MAPSWETQFRGAVAGIIESGAAVRASTAELWAEIRGAVGEAGLSVGRPGWQIVNELRSAASARQIGYRRFQAADDSDLFTPRLAAPDLYQRTTDIRDLFPEFLVRFDLTGTDQAGEEWTRTVSMRSAWAPGMTVADVKAAVDDAAEGLAIKYQSSLSGVANLRPVAI